MLFVESSDGGPARDGMVYFDESSIDSHLSVTGMAWWPNLYRIFYRIGRNRP